LVVVGWNYLPQAGTPAPEGALIGRFATRDNYEGLRVITSALAARLRDSGHRAETLIDDNRLVDRAAAVRAGLGWQGKSTMVLAPGSGPWMLFGSVVTDAALVATPGMQRDCGTCVACLPACPTGALDGDGLDARRCLSTWLQTPGSIPHWIRPRLGRRVYGCDDCSTACPPGTGALARVGERPIDAPFAELLALSDEALLERFHWWYVPRRQGRFIRRNLLVAAGNSAEAGARAPVEAHLAHPSSMIRGHAYWALARGSGDGERLRESLAVETAPEARDELMLALLLVEHPTAYAVVVAAEERARSTPATKGLAVVGPHASGEGEDEEIAMIRVETGHDIDWAGGPMIRVYDPERVLERLIRLGKLPESPAYSSSEADSPVA
jgi:epoxyqueuosine reductase